MANIEIYGIQHAEEGLLLKRRIARLLKDAPYEAEVVLTELIKGSRAHDLKGRPRPYVRIAGTRSYLLRHLPDLIWRLRILAMDVELLVLDGYFSKESLAEMTEATRDEIAKQFA